MSVYSIDEAPAHISSLKKDKSSYFRQSQALKN